MYPRMVVSSERISEVMAMPISIDPNDDGVTETATKGYLEFDKVTFAYPGETESPVLKDIPLRQNLVKPLPLSGLRVLVSHHWLT